MSRTLIIDGDIYCYQAAATAERAVNWSETNCDDTSLWTWWADENEAKDNLDKSVANIMDTLHGDDLIFALSDRENWRKEVLPTYKQNRAKVKRPLVLATVRQYARDTYPVMERPGLEGDDILGILMTSKVIVKAEEKICVTIDKDLKTIPGFHWNTGKPEQGIYEVTEEEADAFHLLQALAGDPTDGYGGCPGVGYTTAPAILAEPHILIPEPYTITRGKRAGEEGIKWHKQPTDDVWACIVSYYAKAGFNEEYALQMAQVARILRNTDYDFKTKKVIPWTPDKIRR